MISLMLRGNGEAFCCSLVSSACGFNPRSMALQERLVIRMY
jgi:hypothetical protein